MSDKNDALQDIVALARNNNISVDEIAHALNKPIGTGPGQSASVLPKLFGYIGGIFVFAGLCVFISMYWEDFGPAARVIVTLGSGFSTFVMALACLGDTRYERAATPLFLISAVLQPSGIFVMLDEYSSGGDPRHGVLFMSLYMLIQQGSAFWAKRRTVLAFCAILFGSSFMVTLFDLWDMDNNLVGIVMGIALMCIAYALSQSRHTAIAPAWYFVSSVILLWSVFDAVEKTPFELIYLGLSAFMVFLSTAVRSRTLLLVSTLSMLGYIGYYTAEHFAHAVGWPIALVIIGIALIGLSSLAVKLNNKYIRG
jgi:Predicted membrane protein (DUF2157)